MYSIRVEVSPALDNFFKKYPKLFEDAKKRALNKSLDLLQKTSFIKAPYKTGQLRREIKQMYANKALVAGTDLSSAYALIQDVGGTTGRNGSVKIKPKHYFFRNAVEQQDKVLNEFVKSFKEIFARV